MMAGMLALAEIAAAPLSVVVSEAGPPRQGCPNLELTQREVDERVRGEHAEGGEWAARYVVTQSSVPGQSEVVRLELSDPEGRVRLRRELALTSEDCSDVALAIALVLERYFADLAAEQIKESELPPPAPAPAPAPAVSQPPAPAPREARLESTLRGGVAGALLLPDPTVALDVSLRFDHDWWSVGVRSALPGTSRTEAIQEGAATLRSVPFRLWFAADALWDDVELSLGPDFLVSLEKAETTGTDETGEGTRLVLGLGAQTNVLVPLAGPLKLGFAAGADVTLPLAMSQFLLRESEREVLKPHVIEGFLGLGLVLSFIE